MGDPRVCWRCGCSTTLPTDSEEVAICVPCDAIVNPPEPGKLTERQVEVATQAWTRYEERDKAIEAAGISELRKRVLLLLLFLGSIFVTYLLW